MFRSYYPDVTILADNTTWRLEAGYKTEKKKLKKWDTRDRWTHRFFFPRWLLNKVIHRRWQHSNDKSIMVRHTFFPLFAQKHPRSYRFHLPFLYDSPSLNGQPFHFIRTNERTNPYFHYFLFADINSLLLLAISSFSGERDEHEVTRCDATRTTTSRIDRSSDATR